VRRQLVQRVERHLAPARAGTVVYGLRWTRIGERWQGFAHGEERWKPLDAAGRLWRTHEHEFRFSGTDVHGEPSLPGRYGALHAVPVGLRGEPTLATARAVDGDPAFPLKLVQMCVDELESLRRHTLKKEPPGETTAAYLVQGTGDEWEADKKRLGRLRKDASEVSFRHLGDLGRRMGYRMPPDHVLAELTVWPSRH
jgi:hypothetical protein